MTKMTLAEIFQRNDHDYDALHYFVEEKIGSIEAQSLVNIIKKKGAMSVIDLEGKIFVIDRPLILKMVDLLINVIFRDHTIVDLLFRITVTKKILHNMAFKYFQFMITTCR